MRPKFSPAPRLRPPIAPLRAPALAPAWAAVCLASLLGGLASAADLTIKGETNVPAYRIVRLEPANADADAAVVWDVYPEEAVSFDDRPDGVLAFTAPPGKYAVKLRTIKGKSVLIARAVVFIGTPTPVPPTPTPGPTPGPTPTPTPTPVPPVPPGPTPPSPAPIPAPGLHVLMVYESGELSKLPPAQLSVLYAKSIRDYLQAKCPVGPDGKTKEWRVWDADTDASGDAPVWRDAMRRPRSSLPWIIVSNGTTGYEGPLPRSIDETLALLKKFGD
jgi:hypothetical protein